MILNPLRIVLMKRFTRRLPVLLALLLFGSGCAALSNDSGVGSDTGSGSGLVVATAFYPLQFVTQRIAGDLATVENLTTLGKEPHDMEPTVKETAEISQADLVVFERGFQPAIDDAVDQNAQGETIDVAQVIRLHQAGDETGHEGEGHEDGSLDPHFWQDPTLLAQVAAAVAGKLAAIDPAHAETFRANAATLGSDLNALDASYADGLASCERTTVVVSHDAFSYLGKYGLRFAPIAGLSPDAEPTPADLGRLQSLITSDGITTVFGERLASPRLTETLASDMNVKAEVLDPIEGLTDQTENEDYLSLMQQNLAVLKVANGCQ